MLELPGEDRSFGQGLFVDPIPETSWYVNVRSAVAARDWYRIRQMVYRRAGHRCEACGRQLDQTASLLRKRTSGSPTTMWPASRSCAD